MIKLQTGVSTDMDFIKAMKERGQDVSAEFPAETLRTQLDLVSEDVKVTFNSTNETILEAVNEGEPGPTPTDLSIDFNIADSVDLFGKKASQLQSNVAESDGEITGELLYVEGYTGFSGDPELQSGNYLALHVNTESEEDVYVELVNGISGPVKLDEDRIIVLRIADKDTQSIKVTTGDLIAEYDISKLIIGKKQVTISIGVNGLSSGDSATVTTPHGQTQENPVVLTEDIGTEYTYTVTATGYKTVEGTLVFDENKSITVDLELALVLTLDFNGAVDVQGNTSRQFYYNGGEEVTLSEIFDTTDMILPFFATSFNKWTEECETGYGVTTVTMDANKTVWADWNILNYTAWEEDTSSYMIVPQEAQSTIEATFSEGKLFDFLPNDQYAPSGEFKFVPASEDIYDRLILDIGDPDGEGDCIHIVHYAEVEGGGSAGLYNLDIEGSFIRKAGESPQYLENQPKHSKNNYSYPIHLDSIYTISAESGSEDAVMAFCDLYGTYIDGSLQL